MKTPCARDTDDYRTYCELVAQARNIDPEAGAGWRKHREDLNRRAAAIYRRGGVERYLASLRSPEVRS